MNIGYLNYSCTHLYSMHDDKKHMPIKEVESPESTGNKHFEHEACFRDMYSCMRNKVHKKLKAKTTKEKNPGSDIRSGVVFKFRMDKTIKSTRDGFSNLLLLKEKEVIEWMEEIKTYVPIEYSLTNSDKGRYVIVNVFGFLNFLELKMVSMFIRFMTEFPLNHIIKDAMNLKRVREYSNLSILNRVLLLFIFDFRVSSGHFFIYHGYLPKIIKNAEEVKEILNSDALQNLDSRFLKYYRGAPVMNPSDQNNTNRLSLRSVYASAETKKDINKIYEIKAFNNRYKKYYEKPLAEAFEKIMS